MPQNIEAKILLHSVNPDGVELITWVLTYPRFIHAEFMTHRAFSRNASSSRAIPVEKMIRIVRDDPAQPEHWGLNQAGMQASSEVDRDRLSNAQEDWFCSAEDAVLRAEILRMHGLHKQIVNRVLEPFARITVLATMTVRSLKHFFGLRAHKDAQPEFQVLAFRMLDLYLKSVPSPVPEGEWHIPFDPGAEYNGGRWQGDARRKIAIARCARVSYLNFDGSTNPVLDLELFKKLSGADPAHASAFEHVACAYTSADIDLTSNFDTGYLYHKHDGVEGSGWLQYRKLVPFEFKSNHNLNEILKNKPDWVIL